MMSPTRCLLVAGVATVLCWGAMILDNFSLLPAIAKAVVRANAAELFEEAAKQSSARPLIPLTVVVADQDHWESTVENKADRSPPVQAFDRILIANTLDSLRTASPSPRAVILDIDVSPATPEQGESALNTALDRWNADKKAPPLLLIRSEDCGEPVNYFGGEHPNRKWRPTPYDDAVAPTSHGPSRIAWVCSLPVPSVDGVVQQFHRYGCAQRQTMPLGVASVGELAIWLWRTPPNPSSRTVGDFYARFGDELNRACSGQESTPRPPQPIVYAKGLREGEPGGLRLISLSALSTDKLMTLRDMAGRVVILGQNTRRSPDRFKTYWADAAPGPVLVAAHIDTMTRYAALRPWPPWLGPLLTPVLSLAASIIFAICAGVRDWVLSRRSLSRAGSASTARWPSATLMLALTSSTVTGSIVAMISLRTLALAARHAPLNAWPQMSLVLLTVTIVGVLVDLAGEKA